MSDTIEGGCQCGQVRYALDQSAVISYACHCRECQKQSASAFGLSVPVAREKLSIRGRLDSWVRETDSGGQTECFFCPDCGSRVYHAARSGRDWVTIKGGSLDDTAAIQPRAHLWVSRKQPWVVIPDAMPRFETQPETPEDWAKLFGQEGV